MHSILILCTIKYINVIGRRTCALILSLSKPFKGELVDKVRL